MYPLYAAVSWGRHREGRRKLIAGGVLFVGLIAAITAFRLAYFGDVVPNTFHSKPGGCAARSRERLWRPDGSEHQCRFPDHRLAGAARAVSGLSAIAAGVGGRGRSAGGDLRRGTRCSRFTVRPIGPPCPATLFPYLPAAIILLWAGLDDVAAWAVTALGRGRNAATACGQQAVESPQAQSAGRWPPAIRRVKNATLAATAVILTLTNVFDARTKMSQMEAFPGYVLAGKNLVGPA